MAGIGPGPHAAMLLADLGAEVIRVDRPGPVAAAAATDVLRRNRRSIVVDLRNPEGAAIVVELVRAAHVLIEGYRPGVAERLGVGPDKCWEANPGLVYGRMTGWGQSGPLAHTAGHDIGYIALTGVLHGIGRMGEAPVPPLNLVGDFGGGSTYLVIGVLAALMESRATGRGQVVDAAIVDGTASLSAIFHGMLAGSRWRDERGVNFLDGGVPWYDTYLTADGRHMAVGALEPQFYEVLLERVGLDREAWIDRSDESRHPLLRAELTRRFASRTQREWVETFAGTDACVAPVLTFAEASRHPHLVDRGTYVEVDGLVQPSAAPRFSAHPAAPPEAPRLPGQDTRWVLETYAPSLDVDDLLEREVVMETSTGVSSPGAASGFERE